MAELIPRAIGLGIPERDTWTMTPAEIIEAVKARSKEVLHLLRFLDLTNAKAIANNRAAHGEKGCRPADYTILPAEDREAASMKGRPQWQTEYLIKLFAMIKEREAARHG